MTFLFEIPSGKLESFEDKVTYSFFDRLKTFFYGSILIIGIILFWGFLAMKILHRI